MEAATKKAEKTKILAQEAQKAAERAKEEALRRAEISRQKALEMEDLFDKAEVFGRSEIETWRWTRSFMVD